MKLLFIAAMALLLFASCRSEDFATPSQNEQLLALNAEEESLLLRQGDGENVALALADCRARRDVILKQIEDATVTGWLSWLPVPLPEPLKKLLVGSISMMAFDRPRQNAAKGIKALFKADWKTAAMAPLRAIGLAHTNNDPLEVLRGAAAAARNQGNPVLAAEIDKQIATIVANQEAAIAAAT